MPLPSHPTRLPDTLVKYRRRTRELTARCRRELKIHPHEDVDVRRLVGWMINHKPDWLPSTWRQYKASVAYVLEQAVEHQQDPLAQEALEQLIPIDVEGCKTEVGQTSSTKLKKFPLRDFATIERYLREHPGRWHQSLRNWLAAALLTGLRPQEWAHATYTRHGDEDALVVQNAKATNGRAHGPTRTLLLGGLSDDERAIVRQHLEQALLWQSHQQYRHFYQACASTLARLSRRLWPRRTQHVSLYSTRHQFSADSKASGMSREEIAALMGHAVTTTAAKHYGKKTAGHTLVRVRPDPLEVERVRRMHLDRYIGPNAPQPQPQPRPRPTMAPPRPSGWPGD